MGEIIKGEADGRAVVGYQAYDAEGNNVQGLDDEPSGLPSFVIMGRTMAEHYATRHPGFRIGEVMEGEVQEPSFEDLEPGDVLWGAVVAGAPS